MRKNCIMCGCAMLENVGGCGCKCHVLTEKLVELNNGDREKSKRELLETEKDRNIEDIFSRAFKIPGVGVGIPMSPSEFSKLLGKNMKDGNQVNVGTAIGDANPYTMSIEDLINHEVFTGIQQGVLKQGFKLTLIAKKELSGVLEHTPKDQRVPLCIAYLGGYSRGYEFGRNDIDD